MYAVDTLIGDITPPESLMKTLTDRKIAQESETTYETQRKAQIQRQTLEKETAIADMQAVVKADQGVQTESMQMPVKKATGDATSVKISAEANAEAIKVNANAEASKQL
jgi:regulator of protease activity HflC (stomatin/prohibitin superfamily)